MIEKLFTSKARVTILACLLFSREKHKLRELARTLKLPASAVSRELKNLQHLSLVKKEKDQFALNTDSNLIVDIRNIFIKTDSFRQELVKSLKNKPVKFVFVFGSFANDSYTADSDLDLFVVGEVSPGEIFKAVKPLEKKLSREINPVVWPLTDLKIKKNTALIRDIARKRVVMIKGEEDELRKIIG